MPRVLLIVVLLAFVAAGCGGGHARALHSAGVPRALARGWAAQASAIAAAASTGDDCHAMHLADTLRSQVEAAERKVPPRLRSALLDGVNALADRTTCTVTTVETVPRQPPKPPGHDKHGDHGHHGPGPGGGGNDQ